MLVSISEKEYKILSVELDLIGQDWTSLSQACNREQALKLLSSLSTALDLDFETKAFLTAFQTDAKRVLQPQKDLVGRSLLGGYDLRKESEKLIKLI